MNEEKQSEITIQKVEEQYVLHKDGFWIDVKVHFNKDNTSLTVRPKDRDERFNFTRSKPSTSDVYDNLASVLMLVCLLSVAVYFIVKTIKMLYV